MTKAERWADDYLNMPRSLDGRRRLIERYDLDIRLGDSLLAAMFEKFAKEFSEREATTNAV